MTRRPCFCAPYHYRLDWNIWFLGFKPHQSMLQRRERWLFAFLLKLLAGDPPALSLLAAGAADGAAFRDPEPPHARKAPRYAKVDMYRYSMAEPLWLLAARWWRAPATPLVWWSRVTGYRPRADPYLRRLERRDASRHDIKVLIHKRIKRVVLGSSHNENNAQYFTISRYPEPWP